MPFAGTWMEELVAEWMILEGFLVEIGLPAGNHEKGGRYEVDVVGARVRNGRLEICHCEVAEQLADNPDKVVKRYANKFSEAVRRRVEEHFRGMLEAVGRVDYREMVVARIISRPVVQALADLPWKWRRMSAGFWGSYSASWSRTRTQPAGF